MLLAADDEGPAAASGGQYDPGYLGRIRALLVEARPFLEEKWAERRRERGEVLPLGQAPSHDMCRFSALFVRELLAEQLGGEWQVIGGTTDADEVDLHYCRGLPFPGGYFDGSAWHDHYWVTDGGWGLVIDVTADQFANCTTPVVVSEDDTLYRENYQPEAVAVHLVDVQVRVRAWLEEYRALAAPQP